MALEYTQPLHPLFETLITPLGVKGLQLNRALDAIVPGELSRMSNLVATGQETRELHTRAGQTQVLTAAGIHHSLFRLNRPQDGTFARFAGVGGTLMRVTGGGPGLATVATGFSGHPLSLVAYRPPLSGESYCFVADGSKMGKITTTGSFLPIGLPFPADPVPTIGVPDNARIATMSAADGTQANAWSPFIFLPLTTTTLTATTLVQAVNVTGPALGVELQTNLLTIGPVGTPGPIAGIGTAKALNLANFDFTATPISDDDILHLNLRINRPDLVSEVRIYLVCSPFTTPPADYVTSAKQYRFALPGMGSFNATTTFSPSAYLLTFRPSDYTHALMAGETLQDAATNVRTAGFLETYVDPNAAPAATQPSYENQLGGSNTIWVTFGASQTPNPANPAAVPPTLPIIRRGDFVKVGSAGQAGTDWSTISGFYIAVQTNSLPTAQEAAGNFPLMKVALSDLYFTGGFGLDASTVATIPYDYRVTHYDPRTGAESNPSSSTTATLRPDPLRQPANVAVTPYGDPAIRQRIYRRGGTLTDHWYFVGTNTADGAAYTDTLTDAAIQTAGTVFLDHDQPVTSVTSAGATVLNQPVGHLLGPLQDLLIAFGDPLRPGEVYWSKTGEPDHWPSFNHVGVCAPSEQLLNGAIYAGQAYVASRERWYSLYVNLAGAATIVGLPTPCTDGLAGEWAVATGPDGIYFIAKDGVRKFTGQHSVLISDAIRPLFHGETRFGLLPVDFTATDQLRIQVVDYDVWVTYKDTGGTVRTIIYSILYDYWRPYTFADPPQCVYGEPVSPTSILLGGTNQSHSVSGFTDNGTPIPWSLRTGSYDGQRPREDKLLGDVILDADFGAAGVILTAQTFLNTEAIANAAQTVTSLVGRQRYLFDPFGGVPPGPQKVRTVSLDLSGTAPITAGSALFFAGVSMVPEPETTMNRVTTYEPLPGRGTLPQEGEVTEGYVIGMRIEADTFGSPRLIHVEYDMDGVITEPAGSPFTINPNSVLGRHVYWISWPVIKAHLIRIRPEGLCAPWQLYRLEWLSQAEPPRIARWDTNWEPKGDSYVTGVDLECDTFGATKSVEIWADQQILDTQDVVAFGRQWVHLTLDIAVPLRRHLYRLVAVDDNDGLLYGWKWWLDAEPSEQTNWNQNYTVANSLSDKWIKGVLLELDTFGEVKLLHVEIVNVDGTVSEPTGSPFAVQTLNRNVLHLTWPKILGRVIRLRPSDNFPSRLYTHQWIFDEDPISVLRWETEELDHGFNEWHTCYQGQIVVKSTQAVTLAITAQIDQLTGTLRTDIYTIPSTGGKKQKRWVPFNAVKGLLWQYLFTSAAAFTLYREESFVFVQKWSGGALEIRHPFGNEDQDVPTRNMIHAEIAAARSGGGSR